MGVLTDGPGGQVTAGRVGQDFDRDAVDLGEQRRVHHLARAAGGDDLTAAEQGHLVRDGGCLVEVVQEDVEGEAVHVGVGAVQVQDLYLEPVDNVVCYIEA